jgi:UDP-N-acetylmuramoyl-tripeptide--D-alanyl-D-alanine ligase
MSTARALFLPSDIESATGGRIVAGADSPSPVRSVVVDSRQARDGSLFVSLPGERTDGHEFLEQAARAGAAAFLVSEAQAARRSGQIAALAARHGVLFFAVRDTLAALQDLARLHMRRCAAVTRIGVTGSNGKTTTKEIIGSILGRGAPIAMNEGNLNSEIGLPIACFGVHEEHRYAVFEMGMNHPGEMDVLADIVRPDFALITNVGTAHIGLLGSQDNIASEKKRIFAHFDGRQAGFLPEGDRYSAFLADGVRGRMILFGPGSTPGYGGSESMGLGGSIIHWEGFLVRFPLFGPHNLANALGAISVARELGVPNAEIRDGLEAVAPLFGRSQVVEGPVTVIVDCYNANPDSMEQAVSFLETVPWTGRRIAVLGGMRELGDESTAAHAALGARLRDARVDAVVLFGAEMEPAWRALAGSPAAARARWIVRPDELDAELPARVRPGDLVLLKGSRGLEMERVLPLITTANRGSANSADYRGSGDEKC